MTHETCLKSINKVVLVHSYAHWLPAFCGPFVGEQLSWVLANTDPPRTKPKIFILWHFTVKACWLPFRDTHQIEIKSYNHWICFKTIQEGEGVGVLMKQDGHELTADETG